jgi:hypothetical protein
MEKVGQKIKRKYLFFGFEPLEVNNGQDFECVLSWTWREMNVSLVLDPVRAPLDENSNLVFVNPCLFCQ